MYLKTSLIISNMSICLVTAFLDIGRSNWSAFRRSNNQYFDNFMPYFNCTHDMIVFMDDKYHEDFRRLCESSVKKNIMIVPINRQFLTEKIHAWSHLADETRIMNSDEFKKLIRHRLHHPECSIPEYNLIQHAKVDFVRLATKMQKSDFYAWTDFGYFQHGWKIPRSPNWSLDINKFSADQINFQSICNFDDKDNDMMYTVVNAPARVGGFFWLGKKKTIKKYAKMYHRIVEDLYANNLVDDDQHIMIRSYFQRPDLIKVWNEGDWHMIYVKFLKS